MRNFSYQPSLLYPIPENHHDPYDFNYQSGHDDYYPHLYPSSFSRPINSHSELNQNNRINQGGMFSISIPNDNFDIYSARRHRSQLNQLILEEEENAWEREYEEYVRRGSIMRNSSLNLQESTRAYMIHVEKKKEPNLKKEKMIKKFYKKNDSGKLESPTCCICLTQLKLNVDVCRLKCKHIFHFKCIQKWCEKKMICPFCRNKIEEKK
jgi:hypothetical protein